jgi:hypothetical protein
MEIASTVRASLLVVCASVACACAAPLERAGLDVELDEALDAEPESELVPLLVSLHEASPARTPVEGAFCIVERASRVPIEAVTDAKGFAQFELDGWPETMAVSCARGHVTSLVGLRASDVPEGVVELEIHAEEPAPASVALTGEILGKASLSNHVFVQASAGVESFEAWGAERYALRVRPGVPFSIVAIETGLRRSDTANGHALEVFAWSFVAHRPTWADADRELELGEGIRELHFVEGSVGLPIAPGSVLRAPGFVGRVWTELDVGASPLLVGLDVESHFEGVERLAYRAVYVDGLERAGELATRIELSNPAAPHYGRSELWLRGVPPQGALETSLLEQPEVLEPRSEVPLEGTRLRWSAEGGQPTRFEACDEGCIHHVDVRWPEGRSEVVLPTLPSRGVGLSAGRLRGVLVSTEGATAGGVLSRRSESWQLVLEL